LNFTGTFSSLVKRFPNSPLLIISSRHKSLIRRFVISKAHFTEHYFWAHNLVRPSFKACLTGR